MVMHFYLAIQSIRQAQEHLRDALGGMADFRRHGREGGEIRSAIDTCETLIEQVDDVEFSFDEDDDEEFA